MPGSTIDTASIVAANYPETPFSTGLVTSVRFIWFICFLCCCLLLNHIRRCICTRRVVARPQSDVVDIAERVENFSAVQSRRGGGHDTSAPPEGIPGVARFVPMQRTAASFSAMAPPRYGMHNASQQHVLHRSDEN